MRTLSGRRFLMLQWASWTLMLVLAVHIATWTSWIVDVVFALLLLYGIRLNLTVVRRVAARIDDKRREAAPPPD